MKKFISTLALAAVLAPSANATVARIKALGNDEIDSEGSYYIQDNRNIFLNAANIHDYANSVILEFGKNGKVLTGDSSSNTTVDADSNPKAQGGFLKKHGNFVYGVYVGNESKTSTLLRVLSTSQAAVVAGASTNSSSSAGHLLNTSDNQVDLFFGWEAAGLKWGSNFLYTKSEDKDSAQKEEDKAMAARFGVKAKNWDAHLNLSLASSAKETVTFTGALSGLGSFEHEFDGKLGVHVGGAYHMGQNTFWAYYKTFKWDQKDGFNYTTGGATLDAASAGSSARGKEGTSEGSFNTMQIGWGNTMTNGDGTLYTSVYFEKKDIEIKLAKTAEVGLTYVPVVLGYESKATDWLTLRGSIIHNLYGKKDNKNYDSINAVVAQLAAAEFGSQGKGSITNSTDVRAGASLNFGNLNIDGLIGATNNGSTISENGNLRLDQLLYRVGMTYKF